MRNSKVSLSISTLVLGAQVLGCGGGSASVNSEGSLGGSRAKQPLTQACHLDSATAKAVDVNNDGKPDIRHSFANGRKLCSELDMNFDGRIDVRRLYDKDGVTAKEEEHDFDFDGKTDQLSFFENGKLVRKELDTNFDSLVDTWMTCDAAGMVGKSERDRQRDGKPDAWESYTNGVLTSAGYDENNDGTPDKWETFKDGRLAQVSYDTNNDGKPDQSEEVPATDSPVNEAVSCDGHPAEAPAAPEPAAPAAASDAAAEGDAGTPAVENENSADMPVSGGANSKKAAPASGGKKTP